MTETEFKIPLNPEGLYIYGILRGDYTKPLIVLCHGYGGWMHETLLYNGARYFEKEGFSTIRLSMYGGGEKSRDIADSDVGTHANDIDSVVEYVRKAGVKHVSMIGHSYSGMAIVYSAKQGFDAAVLWDPTHTDGYDQPEAIKNLENDFIYINSQEIYVSGKGPGYVYAKTVFDNDYPKSQEMASRFNINTCVINASWSKEQQKYGKDYADRICASSEHIIIPNSTHPFTGDGIAEKLFKETAKYLKKQLTSSR
jgi:pimeloyl-ACP methyl ester carboxylesterase